MEKVRMAVQSMDGLVVAFLYALAVITGGVGSCSAGAVMHLVGRREWTLALVTAYFFVGVALGVLYLAFGRWWGFDHDLGDVKFYFSCFLFGFMGTLLIYLKGLVSRFCLKFFGIEVEVTLRDRKSD